MLANLHEVAEDVIDVAGGRQVVLGDEIGPGGANVWLAGPVGGGVFVVDFGGSASEIWLAWALS